MKEYFKANISVISNTVAAIYWTITHKWLETKPNIIPSKTKYIYGIEREEIQTKQFKNGTKTLTNTSPKI